MRNWLRMDRIVGIETEYGCLLSEDEPHVNSELWPAKVKNYLFRKADAGTIDLHYRDYEEPPGNGGFLLNGGRLYLDMGHIEYASPECLHLHDLVTYELAGDDLALLLREVQELVAELALVAIRFYLDGRVYVLGAAPQPERAEAVAVTRRLAS